MSQPQPEPPNAPQTTMSLAAIGSYVVNAGILEGTAARLIQWMRGNPTPGNIADTRSLTWDGLFKALRKEAGAESRSAKPSSRCWTSTSSSS